MGAGGVQSLGRAIDLLELLAEEDEMSLGSLAARSGLPAPTIHRLMATLVQRGYVRRLPSRGYAIGARLIHLGDRASGAVAAIARPHLASLVEEIGETANLALLDGDRVVYVAQVPSRHSMRMFTEVGRRVRLHCTGVGKVLLAQLPPDDVRDLLTRSGMPGQTDRTVTDPDELLEQLPDIAARGFALDDGEQETGVRCIAVPVPGISAEMAMSVSGPEGRLPLESVPRLVPSLEKAAAGLAADLRGKDAGDQR